jgi:hypothetical protein
LPPLLGYVGTTAKTTASEVLKSKQDDPILATWQYGLGKSVAWTSDARKRWSAGWLPWSGYSKFWAQAVRWSMRTSTAGDLQTNVSIDKGRGKVSVEAVDEKGNFLNFLSPKARLITPDYKGRDLVLDQVGPGRYEANFDARQLGTYLVNIRTQRGDKTSSQITGGVLPYSPEYAAIGTDEFLLNGIAERSNGELLSLAKPDSVFGRSRPPARLPVDIWLPLLMIAACLFPLDVAVRRLLIGEEELNKLSKSLAARRKGARAKSNVPAPPSSIKTVSTKIKTAPTQTPTASSTKAPQAPPRSGDVSSTKTSEPPAPAKPQAKATEELQRPVSREPEEVDAMERLRRAKRRARGEE